MTPEQARAELLAALVQSGALTDEWRLAFDVVARHEFIPETIWRLDPTAGARLKPLHRDTDPDLWLALAYRDAPVDVQVDDGQLVADGFGWEVTSSASQPSVVAQMLAELDAQPGQKILEIGTGTGWSAALLAHRVGAENVTSVEIDTSVALTAQVRLDVAGFDRVRVVIGDGAGGCPDGAPYDRVIATVGAREVPYRWVEQTTPGGRVVAPLTNTYEPPGIVTLCVAQDGTASGRLSGPAAFMGMRAERIARPEPWDEIGKNGAESKTDIHPWRLVGDRNAAVAIGQRLGDGVHCKWQDTSKPGTGYQWYLHPESRSWAWLILDEPGPYTVRQGGPRRVFDEITEAYQWWRDAGEPTMKDWLVTVTPEGQTITLEC